MNAIDIFYASDDNYAKPLAVSMVSVLENTDSLINFYILENNISEKSKSNIAKIQKKYNCNVKYIPVNIDTFRDFPDLNWYSLNMYSRFLIPILEPSIEKAIYLDVDIVLISDIKNLYNVNIEDYTIAAVTGEETITSTKSFQKHMSNLNLSNEHNYFGSGVLVINCEKWRRENITEQLNQIIDKTKDSLKYPDQDALNIMFDNNYFKLDLGWNRDIACLQEEYDDDFKVVEKCYLLHFDGREKPWNNSDVFAACIWNKYHNILFDSKELPPIQNRCVFSKILKNPICYLKYVFYKFICKKENKYKKYKRKLNIFKPYKFEK